MRSELELGDDRALFVLHVFRELSDVFGELAALGIGGDEIAEVVGVIAHHRGELAEVVRPGFLHLVGNDGDGDIDAVEDVADVVEDAGGDLGHAGLAGGGHELLVRFLEFAGAFLDDVFNPLVPVLQPRLAIGDLAHFPEALPDGNHEENVLKQDPAGVLDPAPRAGGQHAKDRLRPEDATREMVRGHHNGRRNQHLPVAINRQECQRTEHMKMRFEAAAGQVNQEGRGEHLAHGNGMPRDRLAGLFPDQPDGKAGDGPADEYRGPDVDVDLALGANPGAGRNPDGGGNPGEPLENHQVGKQTVGPAIDAVLMLFKEFLAAFQRGG